MLFDKIVNYVVSLVIIAMFGGIFLMYLTEFVLNELFVLKEKFKKLKDSPKSKS